MKVLGIVNPSEYGRTYLVEVSHKELEKVFNKAAHGSAMAPLKVSEEVNLGKGYDFRNEIKYVCGQMTAAYENFTKASSTMTAFASMVAAIPTAPPESET